MWPEEMVFHLLRTNVSYRNASDAAAAVLLPPPRVWPLKTPSLSERFPLRPQGSLIFGEKEPPSPEPAFKKKNHLLSPPLSKIRVLELALCLSLPLSPLPSQVLTRSLKIFTQRGRPQSTTRLFVSVTYRSLISPIPGKAGSIHLPSVIANTTDISEIYVYDVGVCM